MMDKHHYVLMLNLTSVNLLQTNLFLSFLSQFMSKNMYLSR